MAMSPSSLILCFIFLTIPNFLFVSHASPHVSNYLHHHNQDHLRTTVRQSTGAAASGGAVTVELWCVAMNNAGDAALDSALNWACGPGGSKCGPIQPGGPCYVANNIQSTASYAFNDYYLRNGMTQESCNFDGTAALTSLNPSHGSCKFPSSLSVNNGSFTESPPTLGVGPASADISGSNYKAGRWCLASNSISAHLLYAVMLVICESSRSNLFI